MNRLQAGPIHSGLFLAPSHLRLLQPLIQQGQSCWTLLVKTAQGLWGALAVSSPVLLVFPSSLWTWLRELHRLACWTSVARAPGQLQTASVLVQTLVADRCLWQKVCQPPVPPVALRVQPADGLAAEASEAEAQWVVPVADHGEACWS